MTQITSLLIPYDKPSTHKRPVKVRRHAVDVRSGGVEFTHEHRPSFILGHSVAFEDREDGLWATVDVDDTHDLADVVLDAGGFSAELSPWVAYHDTEGCYIVEEAELTRITWTAQPAWTECADDAD